MKPPQTPPVDEEVVEVLTPEGQRVPVAIRRDIQVVDPATGERRWARTTALLPAANGVPIDPAKVELGRCLVCGLHPLNASDIRRCPECLRPFGIECLGAHVPGPDGELVSLCVECARALRRQTLLQYFFSLR
jgi:hypothetical protein